ncbi:hypothetical protein ANN_21252 [Periplaneta americana]|uniref:Endonuclease-reverse transcriptase n=1 Tax=Periplaneta americana TaxID=6978 RepID=A0ABQ8SEU1_PERAM|nr:hypothetical protein ANN_21252 [Periplaneta americana]
MVSVCVSVHISVVSGMSNDEDDEDEEGRRVKPHQGKNVGLLMSRLFEPHVPYCKRLGWLGHLTRREEQSLIEVTWKELPDRRRPLGNPGSDVHYELEQEIDRRIASAWRKFWSLSFILMDKSQKLQNKRQIFNSCIAPVLLYGAQSWSLTKKQALKLGRCQKRMERKNTVLGISLKDRIRNEEVRRRSGVEDVVILANRTKWRWGGHVVRMQPTRWAHTATLWDPRIGWRNHGRPRTRWGDEFKLQLGGLWARIGRQRTRWKDAVNQL